MSVPRIVLAYSGGLETSVAIRWLAETRQAEVVTVTLDLGRGPDLEGELEDVRDRALAAGAVRAHVLDVRNEFARDFIVPSLKADAVHDDCRPMASALSRPLVARKLVEIAALEQASAIAHGCGAGPDGMRLEAAIRGLAPDIEILAPVRDWGLSTSQAIEYANARGIQLPVATDGATDANLWGRSGPRYTLTKAPSECPSEPAYVDLRFESGVPAAINGVSMPTVELIGSLAHLAGAHGVGRLDARSPDVFEAPAAVALHAALRQLRARVPPDNPRDFLNTVSRPYADLVDRGLWFSPARVALAASADAAQQRATGVVRLKLFKGECVPV